MIRVQYEHETQALASEFLRALASDDAATIWARLSRESRGLLEGRFAARSGLALQQVAGSDGDEVARRIATPVREAAVAALGGAERIQQFGVSAARVVDRRTAYVLLLPDFGPERIVAEEDWKPSHLIAFVNESREWLVDLGRTASISAEAGLPDPLGPIP
jgi:hypothetical protein